MVKRTIEDVELPADFRTKAQPFLGTIPAGFSVGSEDGGSDAQSAIGGDARRVDGGTIDPGTIGPEPEKRRPGRRPWTDEQKAEASARAKARASKEDVAVEPAPLDPTILGFATEGMAFLNLTLAMRTNTPEFMAISRDKCELVAKAWLKFFGYYISLAKATGPMGALAAAIFSTAFVYGPPTIAGMQRGSSGQAPSAGSGQAPSAAPSNGAGIAGNVSDIV